MPEGHTIHGLARTFKTRMVGEVVAASSPQGRFADGAALVDGTVLERTDAYGKHLFLGFAGRRWVHVHLGLYGSFLVGELPPPPVRGALRLRLEADHSWADLRGATVCEVISPAEKSAIERRLGPDPLRRRRDPESAWRRISRSSAPVGALLMDQRVVAGVGNVYRAEILFRAGLSPFLPGQDVARDTWEAMWLDLVTRMRDGLRRGRIVTTETGDRRRRRGVVERDDAFYVYRRTGLPCRRCGTPIATSVLVARNVFWCPTCQRSPLGSPP